MTMKYLNKYILIAVLGAFALNACTDNFEEINTNENEPLSVPSSLYISTLAERTSDIMYSMFVGGDMGGNWAQHWSKVQYNDEERYTIRNSVVEGTVWEGLYAGTLQDAKNMYESALAEGNDKTRGVALIWHAYAFSVLTDAFGDIPYSEALQAKEGENTPAYDLQSDIYPALIDTLANAATYLGGAGTIDATADIIYAGNASNWIKFANSLRLRLLMRESGVVNVSADLSALMSQPMFTGNDDEAKLVYLETNPNANPIWNTVEFSTRDEHRMSSTLIDILAGLNDPRLDVYAELNDDDEYRGKPNGFNNVPNDTYNYTNVSGIGEFYLTPTLPGYYMSYAEQEFLIAEAINKGFITGDATTHYNNAITANFEANGLSAIDAAAYIFSNPYGGDLNNIHLQKWIALYGQGVETWIEWKRTRVPALTPAVDGAINVIPSRYPYPANEQSLNPESYNEAVSRQGADNLTTAVWWMQ